MSIGWTFVSRDFLSSPVGTAAEARARNSFQTGGPLKCRINSAIHQAASLTGPSRSMILTGTIPVEHKNVYWQSMGAAGRNHLWGAFQPAVIGEWPVTKGPAAL